LVFEINRLILIKSSVHSAILDMHSICIRHKQGRKWNFYLANHMSLSIWNSIFRSLFSTQLTHNILTSSKTQLIGPIIIPRWRTANCFWSKYFENQARCEKVVKGRHI
jgi:hypothetical protein